jgi:hypothetical protein
MLDRTIVRTIYFPYLARAFRYDVCYRLALVCRAFAEEWREFLACQHLPQRFERLFYEARRWSGQHSVVDIVPEDYDRAHAQRELGASHTLSALVHYPWNQRSRIATVAATLLGDSKAMLIEHWPRLIIDVVHKLNRAPRIPLALYRADAQTAAAIIEEHRDEISAAILLVALADWIFGMRVNGNRGHAAFATDGSMPLPIPPFVNVRALKRYVFLNGLRLSEASEALIYRNAPFSIESPCAVACGLRYEQELVLCPPRTPCDAPLLALMRTADVWLHTRACKEHSFELYLALKRVYERAGDLRRASRKRRHLAAGVYLMMPGCNEEEMPLMMYCDFSVTAGGLVISAASEMLDRALRSLSSEKMVEHKNRITDHGAGSRYSIAIARLNYIAMHETYDIHWSHIAFSLDTGPRTLRCRLLDALLTKTLLLVDATRCTTCNRLETYGAPCHEHTCARVPMRQEVM